MIASGEVTVPGDKSITHRALFLAALSDGRCRFVAPLAAGDTRSTAAALRRLGVKAGRLAEGSAVTVTGGGLRPFRPAPGVVNCGNSGTTARLLLGLLAGHAFATRLTGDRSLRRRPMARVAEPLSRMGAAIEAAEGGRLPLTVRGGALTRLDWRSPVASAQVKTALFFAGLVGGVPVSVTEPVISRDHTERLLRLLGVRVSVEGTTTTVEPPASLPAFDGEIPGDISSAAYLLAAGVLAEAGEVVVRNVGINPTRAGFLRALERMGAPVVVQERWMSLGEPGATLVARPAPLSPVVIEPDEIPSMVDEVPLLACLASRAERGWTSVFRGVGELRVKESDRLALVAANLAALGVAARTEGDTLFVEGGAPPPKGRVETAGDHRLAMAFAVLGTVPGAAVELDDAGSVAISYPNFFRDLAGVVHPS
ncbi:MAG TPA: 3-phosphoshikimate 1-carboxyvinyltransferase [Gemmatimonadales bacterium]|nr:3-phosphoshikimate 1-carboxyvinyltransferase [Gemmatimonadales bacterium]